MCDSFLNHTKIKSIAVQQKEKLARNVKITKRKIREKQKYCMETVKRKMAGLITRQYKIKTGKNCDGSQNARFGLRLAFLHYQMIRRINQTDLRILS